MNAAGARFVRTRHAPHIVAAQRSLRYHGLILPRPRRHRSQAAPLPPAAVAGQEPEPFSPELPQCRGNTATICMGSPGIRPDDKVERMEATAGLPPRQGLYDPSREHDACGVGFV